MKTKVSSRDIFKKMEMWAPKSLAYDWDNIGLQVGSYNNSVRVVMVTLDVMESTVDEAIKNNVDLIIAHHPLLFSKINQIDIDNPQGRILQKLIKHNITVYASHTNLDIAQNGVNDQLSDQLGLKETKPLVITTSEKLYKLAVFVPENYANQIRSAFSKSGAGHIGNYSDCTYQVTGTGTFKPLEGTSPFIGTKNKLEYVDEVKIETIIKEKDVSKVVQQMIAAHPYEEVAYDLYPLENKGDLFGLGRVGLIDKEIPLQQFCSHVKEVFALKDIRVTGDLKKNIKNVAVLGGSGEKFIQKAHQMGADAYVTGDVTFHQAQLAMQLGLAVIDIGHYSEKIMKKHTQSFLEKHFNNSDVTVITSKENTDPFQFI